MLLQSLHNFPSLLLKRDFSLFLATFRKELFLSTKYGVICVKKAVLPVFHPRFQWYLTHKAHNIGADQPLIDEIR